MRYSIIVASYNRLQELEELLDSVEGMDFDHQDFEILISDDGSTDGTQQYIEQGDFSFNLRYIHQENKGPGEARNHGMRSSDSEYFIFIDSDVILPPDFLLQIDENIKKHNYDAFGGPDTYHPSFGPLLKAINYSMTSFLGTGGTRGSKKSVAKFYPRSFNMGIHRKIFEDIGGMNQLRHGQDMDFSARIYKAGYKVGLIDQAFVYHKRRTSIRRFFKQIYNWGIARINLSNIHPDMLKPVHLLPAFVVASTFFLGTFAIFSQVGLILFMIAICAAIFVAVIAFLQSSFMYKNIYVGLLSILTLFIQVFAYGLGTINGLFQKVMGKKEAQGFTKNYYK